MIASNSSKEKELVSFEIVSIPTESSAQNFSSNVSIESDDGVKDLSLVREFLKILNELPVCCFDDERDRTCLTLFEQLSDGVAKDRLSSLVGCKKEWEVGEIAGTVSLPRASLEEQQEDAIAGMVEEEEEVGVEKEEEEAEPQGEDSSPRGTVADRPFETATVLSSSAKIGRLPLDPLGSFLFCCVSGNNQLKNNRGKSAKQSDEEHHSAGS